MYVDWWILRAYLDAIAQNLFKHLFVKWASIVANLRNNNLCWMRKLFAEELCNLYTVLNCNYGIHFISLFTLINSAARELLMPCHTLRNIMLFYLILDSISHVLCGLLYTAWLCFVQHWEGGQKKDGSGWEIERGLDLKDIENQWSGSSLAYALALLYEWNPGLVLPGLLTIYAQVLFKIAVV